VVVAVEDVEVVIHQVICPVVMAVVEMVTTTLYQEQVIHLQYHPLKDLREDHQHLIEQEQVEVEQVEHPLLVVQVQLEVQETQMQ
jgi:hypothetical protein